MQTLIQTITEALREFLFPLRSASALMTILFFYLILMLVHAAGLWGVWLGVVILPSMVRYMMHYLEARARDASPGAPEIDQFSWLGNLWSLFPIVPLGLITQALFDTLDTPFAFWAIAIAGVLIMPASFCVLAITHSPIQSVSPPALGTLIEKIGVNYLVAPAMVALSFFLFDLIFYLPFWLYEFVSLYLVLVTFGVCGAIVRPFRIVDDVSIEDDMDEAAGEEKRLEALLKLRESELATAYSFASRNNVEGALQHIMGSMEFESNALEGLEWYFTKMLEWENSFPALKLGQLLLHELLLQGREVEAVKLMMRCKLIDHRFRPKPEDIDASVQAAENCNNIELAKEISHGRWQGLKSVD